MIARALDRGVPEATIRITEYDGDVDPAEVQPADKAQLGIPSTGLIRMAAWRGGEPALLDVSVVCRPDRHSAESFVGLMRRQVEAHGFDYAGGITLFPRHAIALALVSFDKSNPSDTPAIRLLFPELIAQASARGGASYRSHLAYMDLVSDQYDHGDFALKRLQEHLEDALDSAGILSPGKQGIWPARYRGPPPEVGG